MNNSILVISSTNRPESNTRIIAEFYCTILKKKAVNVSFMSLEELPDNFLVSDLYDNRSDIVENIINNKLRNVEKFVFVIPEYNGGFPGVLKLFIDGVPPECFHGKKAGLIGLSSGKQGGSRGMDAFTNVLNYLKISVLYAKPKLSGIEKLISENKQLIDDNAIKQLELHAEEMIHF